MLKKIMADVVFVVKIIQWRFLFVVFVVVANLFIYTSICYWFAFQAVITHHILSQNESTELLYLWLALNPNIYSNFISVQSHSSWSFSKLASEHEFISTSYKKIKRNHQMLYYICYIDLLSNKDPHGSRL